MAAASNAALRVRYLAPAEITPAPRNARTHSPAQVQQIARSIGEFGFTNPILLDEASTILAGHGRLEAAKGLGLDKVPTITLAGLSDAQKRALALADNRLALSAGWDEDTLRLELGELGLAGYDLSLIGFSDDEMAAILAEPAAGQTDPDEAPEPPAEPVSRLGDVWLLGRHRVMCGDATNPQHVATLTDGRLADLCFTSPPYLHQRDYQAGVGDWDQLMQDVFGILPVTHEAQVLVNLGMVHRNGEWLPYWDGWVEWMRTAGWRRFGWYVWDQGPGLPGDWNGRLAPSHEWLFHFNRVPGTTRKSKQKLAASIGLLSRETMRQKNGTTKGFGDPRSGLSTHKVADSVIRVSRRQGHGIHEKHPAIFPVDLVSEMLTAFSDPDDTVYEPFCGSGTQLISAQKNGRTCLGMEIAPAYVDVSIIRWQNFSGQQATLEADGRTFADVATERTVLATECV